MCRVGSDEPEGPEAVVSVAVTVAVASAVGAVALDEGCVPSAAAVVAVVVAVSGGGLGPRAASATLASTNFSWNILSRITYRDKSITSPV